MWDGGVFQAFVRVQGGAGKWNVRDGEGGESGPSQQAL
jgi:hypothetical protein